MRRARHERYASVQELLPLEAIEGDVVRLRDGGCRAILRASSVNFALKSEAEQEAILAAYQRFLNALSYPLQLLVRVVPSDIEAYLARLHGHHTSDGGEAWAALARDHEAFVRRLGRERTLLDRRCYVVVPAEPRLGAAPGLRWPWRRAAQEDERRRDLLVARRQLTARCSELEQGLAACGIRATRLDGDALLELWQATLGGRDAVRAGSLAPATPVLAAPRTGLARA